MQINTFNEHFYPLIDENIQLKTHLDNLQREHTELNPNILLDLQEKVYRLEQIQQTFTQHRLSFEHSKTNYHKTNEQLHIKTSKITSKIHNILKKIQQNTIDFHNNNEHIQMLGKDFFSEKKQYCTCTIPILIVENKLSEEESHYLQFKYQFTEMKSHSEAYRTKQQLLKMQLQVSSNNMK